MKKTLATIGIASGLAFAGLGVAQVASAQTTDESTVENDTTAEESEARDGEGRRGNRGVSEGRDGEGRRGKGCGKNFEAVAEILGMEADEIRAQLDEGMSLADIAEANDVDPDELVDAMVAAATERIDEKVAEGDLTDEEAAEKLAEKSERIEDKVYDTDDAEAAGEGS